MGPDAAADENAPAGKEREAVGMDDAIDRQARDALAAEVTIERAVGVERCEFEPAFERGGARVVGRAAGREDFSIGLADGKRGEVGFRPCAIIVDGVVRAGAWDKHCAAITKRSIGRAV